jgi:hypothetical protein
MIYAAERNVRTALNGFYYDDLIDPEFLKSLPFVKTIGDTIITQIQYPNQTSTENKSLCLTLWKDNKLVVTLVTECYYPNDTVHKSAIEVDVLYLLKDLSIFSGYDRFLALTFLAQTNFNL